MPERDSAEFHPPKESSFAWIGWLVAVALAIGAAWWFWWPPAHLPASMPETPAVSSEAPADGPEDGVNAPDAAASAASAPIAQASEANNPVDALAPPDENLPAVIDSDEHVTQALGDLLGAQRMASFLQLDGFVRRAVVTVDNLARPHAPARLWPVQPMAGRFMVDGPEGGPGQTIAPGNASRYDAFVAFVESVPLDPAVKLYARLYPLFQSAYEDLGFPGQYFNNRLVRVLDTLLATPAPEGPIAVQLTEVKGGIPSTTPWLRYEYADAGLESLTSGQKILLRMGPENARRLKAIISQLRQRVATGVTGVR